MKVYECTCDEMCRMLLVAAPAGCDRCVDEIQPGHFTCRTSPQWLLDAERLGIVARRYHDGEFVWQIVADESDESLIQSCLVAAENAWFAWGYHKPRNQAEFVGFWAERWRIALRKKNSANLLVGPTSDELTYAGVLLRQLGWRLVRDEKRYVRGAEFAPGTHDPVAELDPEFENTGRA